MAKMLILTGPQGAGNHLWSKIFSLHCEVYGWKTLLENYWEAHRFAEPFAQHWRNPDLLKSFDWTQNEYYFTSISLPLGIIGSNVNPIWVPDVQRFVATVLGCGIDIEIAVCGRDQNILNYQQTRVRTQSTLSMFLEQLPKLWNPTFLSYELLYLYKQDYLKSLKLNIPIAWNDPSIDTILENDSNLKYTHYVDEYILDNGNRTGIPLKELPK
jgi:hypothetical protein